MGKDYRRITAWQKCDAFAFGVYRATKQFPHHETYGLTSQLRRAALSAPTNIVEGCGRNTQKDYLLFLNRAETSLEEAGYLLDFAARLGYLKGDVAARLLDAGQKRLVGLWNGMGRSDFRHRRRLSRTGPAALGGRRRIGVSYRG